VSTCESKGCNASDGNGQIKDENGLISSGNTEVYKTNFENGLTKQEYLNNN
jgi:hypothetical protein